jgi:hypothetical protein
LLRDAPVKAATSVQSSERAPGPAHLKELRDGQRSVGDLAGALGVSQPNVRRQPGVLRDPGFVTTERFHSSVHYALTIPKVVRSACSVIHGSRIWPTS